MEKNPFSQFLISKGNIKKLISDYTRYGFRNFSFLIKNISYIQILSVLKLFFYEKLLKYFYRENISDIIQKILHFNFTYKTQIESEIQISHLIGLLRCISKTKSIKGSIIELGAYKGGTSILIAKFLRKMGLKKILYICDTFEGHPYDDKYGIDEKSRFSDTNISYVKSKFRKFRVAEKIKIIKGEFEKTLYGKLGNEIFSFAFMDCDLYQSSKISLNFLIPRMRNGSIIAIHDYANPKFGISKAVHELCIERGFKIRLFPIPHLKM